MKKLLALPLAVLILIGFSNCTTDKPTIAYKTIFSLETAVTKSYDGYTDLIVHGQVRTNELPTVAKAFNHFQASALIAQDAAQFNTNALAPSSLLIEGTDLMNLIATIRKK